LYKLPTIAEMLGLKKPLPTIRQASAKKNTIGFSHVINKCPSAIIVPPMITATLAPRTRSANIPPKKGVM